MSRIKLHGKSRIRIGDTTTHGGVVPEKAMGIHCDVIDHFSPELLP